MRPRIGAGYTAITAALDSEIGARVTQSLNELGLSKYELSKAVYNYLGFETALSAHSYLTKVQRGHSLWHVNNGKERIDNLGRLSRVLYLVLPDDDPLIQKIHSFFQPRFKYPPPLEGLTHQNVQEAQAIDGQDSLSLEERLAHLTLHQQALLERLIAAMEIQNTKAKIAARENNGGA